MNPPSKKQKIFSGIQPSGVLHIGNYLGAIKNWVALQDLYESFFCVVDYHAITVKQDPELLRQKTIEVAKIYLAAGIDPKKCTVFIQSHVPEHTELTWILNCITPIAELQRMTQFKDKSKKSNTAVTAGLFDYPVLMAADILLYQTNLVPVGLDQKQHVELTRTIAKKFNNLYKETFTVPEVIIEKQGAKIFALDDPSKKMSKSDNRPNQAIALTDSPQIIAKKISRAVTDSGTDIKAGPDKPALSNLLTIFSLFSETPIKDLEKRYQNKGYADFKKDLANAIIDALKPFQKKMKDLDDKTVLNILEKGAKTAQPIAAKTLKEVKEKIGIAV